MTASARSMGHVVSLGITGAMMIGITGYTIYTAKRRRGNFWFKWGPSLMLVMASLLIMADVMRHVLQDYDVWPSPSSRQYKPGCHDETFRCLSDIGWYDSHTLALSAFIFAHSKLDSLATLLLALSSLRVFTIFCTYTGFAIMLVGTMWNADLLGKLASVREKWRELRGTAQ